MASGFPQGRSHRGRSHTAQGRCRDCGELMLWATTGYGSRIPLDIEPAATPDGRRYLVVERERDWRLAIEIRDHGLAEEVLELGMGLRTHHFDTCPKRRPRERADLA